MSPELLNLHISQLVKTVDKSKTNKYADIRKQKYHDKLIELLSLIKAENVFTHDYNKQKNLKEVLDFVFHSIEFLDNSTLTNIPHEIIYSLEKALSNWDETDGYIIVTSLQNNISGYSFNPILALFPEYYDIINSLFNVQFDHKLIQIKLPRYLVHDYLANVVLYHELGHFIEMKYKISERLTNKKIFLGELTDQEAVRYYLHTSELFSDIFAAQYVGDASNHYLNYIAHKNKDSNSHPSTDKRIKTVDDFLNERTDNKILNDILEATRSTTGNQLKKRYHNISEEDFIDFIPPEINSIPELHSIYGVGWNLWRKEIKSFKDKNIDELEKHLIINNLIEKSISNYMVLEKWKK
jgi:hypothetical protein